MPTLKELAPLLTELAALKARVEELLAENAALRAQLDQLARDAKRQAAPFSKGQRKAQPKRPGRKPGRGRFTFRTLPTPDQWTAPRSRSDSPIRPAPVAASRCRSTGSSSPRSPTCPLSPSPIVQPYRVWVYRCPGL